MRTTSPVEAMHSVFNRQFPKKSNIFDFVENLRQFEYSKSDKIQELINDKTPSPRMQREKDRIRDEKIERISQLLKNHSISIKQFLEEMSKQDGDESEYESECESEDERDDGENSGDETD